MDTNTIVRIRKLFALARDSGATEAEAALAAEKASQLLMEHKLSMAEIDGYDADADEPVQNTTLDRVARRPWADDLLNDVAASFSCRVIFDKGNAKYHVVGRPTDVAITIETFHFIGEQVQRLAATHTEGRSARAAYRRGLVDRVAERLKLARARVRSNSQSRALVLRDDNAIEAFLARLFPVLVTVRRPAARMSSEAMKAWHEGWAAGSEVALGGRTVSATRTA